jgi:hypothetical protein
LENGDEWRARSCNRERFRDTLVKPSSLFRWTRAVDENAALS